MSLVSSLFLSTVSTVNPPVNKANLANVSWNVDWDQIFHGRTGLCRVYVHLISASKTITSITTSWNTLLGTVRANFSSDYSINTSGVNLVNLTPNPIAGTNTDYFLTAITEQNAGPLINIPTGKQNLNIQLIDTTETTLLANAPDYEILFIFEWISPPDVDKNFPRIS